MTGRPRPIRARVRAGLRAVGAVAGISVLGIVLSGASAHSAEDDLRGYGDRVMEVEYRAKDFRSACLSRGERISVVLRDRDLVAPGRPGYVRQAC